MTKIHRAAVLMAAVSQVFVVPTVINPAPAVAAQSSTSNVAGMVRDSQGFAVAGARVLITRNTSGQSRTVYTDEQGAFSATGLPSGTYTISVSHGSFVPARYGDMRLVAGGWAQLNAQLTPRDQ